MLFIYDYLAVMYFFHIFANEEPSKASFQPMSISHFLHSIFHLYYDGFRNMTLGRTLWAVILIKLFIIFAILKVFFFPNFISQHAEEGDEADFVATELLNR